MAFRIVEMTGTMAIPDPRSMRTAMDDGETMTTRTSERVLVTGACGALGQVVVKDLLDHGYDVAGADRRMIPGGPIRVVETDLTDVGQVAYTAQGAAGIIPRGAIPSPYGKPDEVVFRNNTGATFAVLQAASLLGITSVVIASSISAYGMAWAPTYFDPLYVPIDETHPMRNHDAYGHSKEVDELTARMVVRRTGMSVAALRFHWIATREAALARTQVAPEPRDVRQMFGYVEQGDAARACRLAFETARDRPFGFEAFNIVAADTLASEETEVLVRRHAPDLEIRTPLPGFNGGFDIAKASRLLGWEPTWSWRDHS
ncbi:MAG: NAD(P)-dependent oxidoreductase [Thermomicrobiales bacterium]